MQKITPFLMFNEGAGEAMEFYASIFANAKISSKIPGPGGVTMGGTLEIDGNRILTFNGGPHFSFCEGMSMFVNAETQEEIDHLYDSLSEGGEKQPGGWLKDKFGVSWQIVPPILMELMGGGNRDKANRVLQAVIKMNKIDIQALKQAAEG